MPKPKKVKKSTLKAKADILFSQLIRKRGYCQLKGLDKITCSMTLQCMHIIGRGNLRLRYNSMNALSGCSGHHMYYTVHPFEFVEMIRTNFPDQYGYVMKHREEKIYNMDYNEVILQLCADLTS